MTFAPYMTTCGFGQYIANEGHIAYLPGNWQGGSGKFGALYAHGAAGSYLDPMTSGGVTEILAKVATFGIPVLSCDLGGVHTWGNDTAISRVGTARTFFNTRFGVDVSEIFLIGGSMGNLVLLNWARQNPTLVKAAVSLLGVADVADIHANNRVGLTDEINAAYGGSYVDSTQRAEHNPAYYVTQGDLDSIPIQWWYATDDNTTVPAATEAFAAAHPDTDLRSVGNLGHSEAATAAIDEDEVLEFLVSHY